MDIQTKRVYVAVKTDDSCRVLVDRIWFRGLTKVKAEVDFGLMN